MKYINTMTAVTRRVEEGLRVALGTPSPDEECKAILCPSLCRADRYISRVLREDPDQIAYYGSCMDGWDATHDMVQEWLVRCRPQAETAWQEYIDTGTLICRPDDLPALGLVPPFSARQIRKACKGMRPEKYAIKSFLANLNNAAEFAESTKTTLVCLSYRVGVTLDDSQYPLDEY
jgi:hypothetical protein